MSAFVLACGLSHGLAGLAAEAAKPADQPWIAPARAARKPNPVAVDANSITQGRALFTMACEPCHGPSGKGDGPAAPSLERKPGNLTDPKMWEQSDGALFWKIGEGKNPMPVFQEVLSEEQRWQVVNYVRTLAPQNKTIDTTKGTTP
ncbi:MAG: c-type cytochrome [Verrucomicrobia bacterium]|nr:c-type cytochrome [Verrucomicrobiota bacterium]